MKLRCIKNKHMEQGLFKVKEKIYPFVEGKIYEVIYDSGKYGNFSGFFIFFNNEWKHYPVTNKVEFLNMFIPFGAGND